MGTQDAKPRKRFRLPVWALIILVLLLGLAVFGDQGLLRVYQAGRQKAALEAEVRRLREANDRLQEQVEDLRNDRRTIENMARKELGMVKDDEIVYQFRDPPAAGGSPKAGEKAADSP